jgi:hypothetical protein
MTASLEGRCAVLTAALGFLQLSDHPSEVAMLHRWLDSWKGLGAIVTGMERQGYDVSLTKYAQGWRATFIHPSTGRARGSGRC